MRPIVPPLRALGNMVIVQPIEEKEKMRGSIIVPQSSEMKRIEGVVVAVGDGMTLANGEKFPLDVNVGDAVIYDYRAADPVEFNGTKYLFLPYEALLAVKQ